MPSAVVKSFRYLSGRRELEITFRPGRTYAYRDVPRGVAEAMKTAPSKGEFFSAEIRERYPFERRTAPATTEPEVAWKGS